MAIGYKNLSRMIVFGAFAMVSGAFLTQCKKDEGVNVFSLEDDRTLGQQVKAEIEGNPAEYPILNRQQHAQAYAYLDNMYNGILNSGEVRYRNEFNWEAHIIRNDSVVNAFCAPGGYICVYTGLIKFLNRGSDFAGVLGHEIAHADKRHTTEQLTRVYGLTTLLSVVVGDNPGLITQIAQNLLFLSFSRANEAEADKYSVIYLCPTDYRANGAASFFQKLIDLDLTGNTPQFLSTHPNPENRVPAINTEANARNCGSAEGPPDDVSAYEAFKNALP